MLLKISITLFAAVLAARPAYAETITYDTSGVSEPASLTLLGVGAMLTAMHARRTANTKRKNDCRPEQQSTRKPHDPAGMLSERPR